MNSRDPAILSNTDLPFAYDDVLNVARHVADATGLPMPDTIRFRVADRRTVRYAVLTNLRTEAAAVRVKQRRSNVNELAWAAVELGTSAVTTAIAAMLDLDDAADIAIDELDEGTGGHRDKPGDTVRALMSRPAAVTLGTVGKPDHVSIWIDAARWNKHCTTPRLTQSTLAHHLAHAAQHAAAPSLAAWHRNNLPGWDNRDGAPHYLDFLEGHAIWAQRNAMAALFDEDSPRDFAGPSPYRCSTLYPKRPMPVMSFMPVLCKATEDHGRTDALTQVVKGLRAAPNAAAFDLRALTDDNPLTPDTATEEEHHG